MGRQRSFWLRFLIALGVLVLALGLGQVLLPGGPPSSTAVTVSQATKSELAEALGVGVAVGKVAPDFVLPTLASEPMRLGNLQGKVVLINFWATWCPPCRAEMPDLNAVYREKKDQGLVILGVDIQEDRETVAAFVEKFGIAYPILLDTEGRVTQRYLIRGLPTSIFVDRQGLIRRIHIGAISREGLLTLLEPLLEETAALAKQ